MGIDDLFVLYTDGVTDAMNADGDMYGEERLKETLLEHRTEPAHKLRDSVMQSVNAYSTGGELPDDVTLIVMRVTPM